MKQNLLINPFLFVAMLLVVISGCEKDEENIDKKETQIGPFTDLRDGNVYQTVSIGDQIWMAENLKFIPSVVDFGTGSNISPLHYVYGYGGTSVAGAKASENYATYGVLYNWPAAIKACPDGWHLPSDGEWEELENYLAENGYNYDGTTGGGGYKIAKSLASTSGWVGSSREGAVGNTDYPTYRNKSGFSAFPGGYPVFGSSTYTSGSFSIWWSSSENNAKHAYGRYMGHNLIDIRLFVTQKENAYSVRCVRD